MHSANHMEMNGIRTQNESLTHIEELDAVDSGGCGLIARGVHNDDGAVLVVGRGLRITLVLDVSREKTHLSAHLKEIFIVSSEILHTCVMLVEQGFIKGDDRVRIRVRNRLDSALLGVSARVIR